MKIVGSFVLVLLTEEPISLFFQSYRTLSYSHFYYLHTFTPTHTHYSYSPNIVQFQQQLIITKLHGFVMTENDQL